MRTVKQIHQAVSAPIDDLITWRVMPTTTIEHLDPFLFLNHHGPQQYLPGNPGLPFGPHPHRGFETLTFILEGDLVHWDSGGGKSVIREGGIQWMTAGRGLIHAEISSDEFKKNGGPVEILQLWINLPAKLKMTEPNYTGLQKEQIPVKKLNDNTVSLNVISGNWEEVKGPASSLTGIEVAEVFLNKGSHYQTTVDPARTLLFYMVRGKAEVNGMIAEMHELVEWNSDGEKISVKALENSVVIIGHGVPFHEPIVAYGPFVMNTEEQIRQAYDDYQQGRMGDWKNFNG